MTLRYTEEDYLIIQQRQAPAPNSYSNNHEPDEGPESKLAARIREWAKERGYKFIIHPQTPKLSYFLEPGMPDIVLFLPFGITACFELKSKKGRLSEKQKLTKSMLNYLGHQVYLVRSFKGFLQIVTSLLRRE